VLAWLQFVEGVRDAMTDLLDDEVGGTPEEVVAANIANASGYEDAPRGEGYRLGCALVVAYLGESQLEAG
jgi:hypothetical protein